MIVGISPHQFSIDIGSIFFLFPRNMCIEIELHHDKALNKELKPFNSVLAYNEQHFIFEV